MVSNSNVHLTITRNEAVWLAKLLKRAMKAGQDNMAEIAAMPDGHELSRQRATLLMAAAADAEQADNLYLGLQVAMAEEL